MKLYSYHVFLFPFQWEQKNKEGDLFTQKIDISVLKPSSPQWLNLPLPQTEDYMVELYNEKNYFYPFVHDVLYENPGRDKPIIRHFERKEAYDRNLSYVIGVKAGYHSVYRLEIKSIVLNLYSTGTGILIFYLVNSNYPDLKDIKRINQFGRRILPPFIGKEKLAEKTKESELADFIALEGLEGRSSDYYEDFLDYTHAHDWKPASFIDSLIRDLDPGLSPKPVIDDRMFVMSFIANKDLEAKLKSDYNNWVQSEEWYSLLYIDGYEPTCQNDEMRSGLSLNNTNPRWQKYGTLYGITRYSFVTVTGDIQSIPEYLLEYFRTMYVRLVELTLVQRASILRFSGEVTHLSSLAKKPTRELVEMISDFYKAYIRFVNQVFFREVTAQEQGIEFYDKLLENMRLKDQVKDLDEEISELHQYAALLEDKERNQSLAHLTVLGTLFLIPALVTGILGMNLDDFNNHEPTRQDWFTLLILLVPGLIVAPVSAYLAINTQNKISKKAFYTVTIIGILTTTIIYLIKS